MSPKEKPSETSKPKPKPKANTMTTPFTTIINPLYQTTGTEDPQLLTFWIDGGSDLVLQARTSYTTINEPVFTTNSTEEDTGPLENPSSLTSFVYNSLLSVYGITPKKDVARISPTFDIVDPENANVQHFAPSLAGCSDGQNSAWLYYFK
ncbi:hypothetical protein ABW20_dc0109381 [Dactylellina cionopaga]|nr:hypothetical protein ABW20_dc0109381 [Dactylellina cionopaga]